MWGLGVPREIQAHKLTKDGEAMCKGQKFRGWLLRIRRVPPMFHLEVFHRELHMNMVCRTSVPLRLLDLPNNMVSSKHLNPNVCKMIENAQI